MLILPYFDGACRTGETTYSRQWHEIIIELKIGRPNELPSYPNTHYNCNQSQGQQSPRLHVSGHSCKCSIFGKVDDETTEDKGGS